MLDCGGWHFPHKIVDNLKEDKCRWLPQERNYRNRKGWEERGGGGTMNLLNLWEVAAWVGSQFLSGRPREVLDIGTEPATVPYRSI